jgi:hypothetical protein
MFDLYVLEEVADARQPLRLYGPKAVRPRPARQDERAPQEAQPAPQAVGVNEDLKRIDYE